MTSNNTQFDPKTKRWHYDSVEKTRKILLIFKKMHDGEINPNRLKHDRFYLSESLLHFAGMPKPYFKGTAEDIRVAISIILGNKKPLKFINQRPLIQETQVKKPEHRGRPKIHTKKSIMKSAASFFKERKELTPSSLNENGNAKLYIQITKYWPSEYPFGSTACEKCLEELRKYSMV